MAYSTAMWVAGQAFPKIGENLVKATHVSNGSVMLNSTWLCLKFAVDVV